MNRPASIAIPERGARATRPRDLKLTIEQFVAINESGALDDFSKAELLDGKISVVNAQHLPHARLKMALYDALRDAVRANGTGLQLLVEGAIELGRHNLPEPDLFIWAPQPAERGAPDGSVKLVIEVADSSERRDLGRKKRIYAAHGIAEYWVAVMRTRRIERFAGLKDGAYARHDSVPFGNAVDSVTLSGIGLPAGWRAE
ncbi:Uma2 family endonuclease [Sphingomonas sp. 1P06PA]|uniref:Uma2 family endonuclease n=1 Tax=Sphingomonas sp. 1P06PA TaxID=554121 RepID=UPI0039A6271A